MNYCCDHEGCTHMDIRYTPIAMLSIHNKQIYDLMISIYDRSAELYGYGAQDGLIWKDYCHIMGNHVDLESDNKYNILPTECGFSNPKLNMVNNLVDYSGDPSLLAIQAAHNTECDLRNTKAEYDELVEKLKCRISYDASQEEKNKSRNEDFFCIGLFIGILYYIINTIINWYVASPTSE